MNKKEARTLIKEKRTKLSQAYIDVASDKIFEKLLQNEDFKNAKVVMSYMDFKNEVKTDKINDFIKNSGKILLLPKVIDKETMIAIEDKNQYIISPFGNKEPNGEEYKGSIDVIITPGVAFDKDKNRVGFGRGYYDRFFVKYPNAKKIAIAFEEQIIDEGIETDKYDKKVDILITENNIIK
ncbi:5-formyltetrahydrofolate cyclo-ligase [Fusobacterium nucleatum YWH7199]|uniref:5-formyltetrahydrofolate cyclo-ligase n=1 Tax=Fusobacterium nucleatum TaxID=851 RepID=UPI00201AA0B6|nr:5-formyltetrahydrofolate cyclo-ligase [Fusobacterium nucleatum]MCL4580676.1 5-formyltetrahydrofolate cyclo-ligase [Fusobacterium nucleatum YWH7199]